jgi:hypothetical protein
VWRLRQLLRGCLADGPVSWNGASPAGGLRGCHLGSLSELFGAFCASFWSLRLQSVRGSAPCDIKADDGLIDRVWV